MPGIEWQLLPLVAAFAGAAGGCMMALGAFFRGGDRTKRRRSAGRRRRPSSSASASWPASSSSSALPGWRQTSALHSGRLASATLVLLASVGSFAILVVGLLFSVPQARLRLSLRRAETELQRRSFRDGLTGLPDRLTFDGMLAQAVGRPMAPISGWRSCSSTSTASRRSTNPSATRPATWCCAEVAPRLKRFARPEDRVAHLGGDEYLLLIGADPSAQDAAIFAERLQSSIGEPCRMNGREATVSSSIGIALYPEHGPISALIANAEAAMSLGQGRRRRRLRLLRAAHD